MSKFSSLWLGAVLVAGALFVSAPASVSAGETLTYPDSNYQITVPARWERGTDAFNSFLKLFIVDPWEDGRKNIKAEWFEVSGKALDIFITTWDPEYNVHRDLLFGELYDNQTITFGQVKIAGQNYPIYYFQLPIKDCEKCKGYYEAADVYVHENNLVYRIRLIGYGVKAYANSPEFKQALASIQWVDPIANQPVPAEENLDELEDRYENEGQEMQFDQPTDENTPTDTTDNSAALSFGYNDLKVAAVAPRKVAAGGYVERRFDDKHYRYTAASKWGSKVVDPDEPRMRYKEEISIPGSPTKVSISMWSFIRGMNNVLKIDEMNTAPNAKITVLPITLSGAKNRVVVYQKPVNGKMVWMADTFAAYADQPQYRIHFEGGDVLKLVKSKDVQKFLSTFTIDQL